MPPSLVIYMAKGAPNSCGPGCERWIAIEGKVDADAAARVSRFMRRIKGQLPPIYLYSPGGVVEQAYPIGRLLRERKATARVGKTVVAACANGTQVDDACLKLKSSNDELDASIRSAGAFCNSSCSYIFLGAVVREVPADAAVAVHHSKLTVSIRGTPTPQQRAQIEAKLRNRADTDQASYIRSMGMPSGLTDVINAVPFESMHVLTRPELVKFGIDTRNFVETPWVIEMDRRAVLKKFAVLKGADGTFRKLALMMSCGLRERTPLVFMRETNAAFTNRVSFVATGDGGIQMLKAPLRQGDFEGFSVNIWSQIIADLPDMSQIRIGEETLVDGAKSVATVEFETASLKDAWA